ncbi:MAG: hypothetical protein R3B70_07730 [Polyangiaceae bacterium]
MRRRALCSVLGLAGLGLAITTLLGCPVQSSDDCEALGNCGDTGDTTTSSTTDSTTTSLPEKCVTFAAGDVVDAGCGLFVSPAAGSDDEGDGSRDKPFATLSKALLAPAAGAIYVCEGKLTEALTITGDAHLLGGFECAGWSYTATKPQVEAPPDAPAITVEDGALFHAADLAFTAQSAKSPGASSIGIFLKTAAELDLARVDLTIGAGAPGVPGETVEGVAQGGGEGTDGGAGCIDNGVLGGNPGLNECGASSSPTAARVATAPPPPTAATAAPASPQAAWAVSASRAPPPAWAAASAAPAVLPSPAPAQAKPTAAPSPPMASPAPRCPRRGRQAGNGGGGGGGQKPAAPALRAQRRWRRRGRLRWRSRRRRRRRRLQHRHPRLRGEVPHLRRRDPHPRWRRRRGRRRRRPARRPGRRRRQGRRRGRVRRRHRRQQAPAARAAAVAAAARSASPSPTSPPAEGLTIVLGQPGAGGSGAFSDAPDEGKGQPGVAAKTLAFP